MSVEIDRLAQVTDTGEPPYDHPDYVATRLRAPNRPLLLLPDTLADPAGPVFGSDAVSTRGTVNEPAKRALA